MNPHDFDVAVYAKLTASTAITTPLGGTAIYRQKAPENTDPPFVIYGKQSGVPNYTLGGVAFEDQLYMVKTVTLSNSGGVAGTVADAIDDTLQDASLTIAGHTHMYLRRDSDIDYSETGPGGQVYQHRGALYRIKADPADRKSTRLNSSH